MEEFWTKPTVQRYISPENAQAKEYRTLNTRIHGNKINRGRKKFYFIDHTTSCIRDSMYHWVLRTLSRKYGVAPKLGLLFASAH
jgi:hypothetical protein